MTETAKTATLVTFLLDRSWSMSSCRESTIEAFNGYVGTLRDAKTPILFTFLQFDSQALDKVHFEKPIKEVPDLSKETYQPRSRTPLIEAATKTIQALETALKAKTATPKVVVCIQTDGEENQSGPEYSWKALKDLIAAKTAEGWQFNFMGAGIDAYDQGAKMGFSASATMSYDSNDLVATRAAFVGTASNSVNFAAGLRSDTGYSVSQKMASGDKFDPTINPHGPKPTIPTMRLRPSKKPHLDLTAGSGSVPNDVLDLTQ